MKKIIITTKTLCWGILLFLFQIGDLQAQTSNANISVLKMVGASNHFSHFDTNVGLKTMLLDQGASGEATIEFWAKFQNNAQSLLLTADAFNDTGLTFKMRRNSIALESKDVNDIQAINPPANITETYWQHFAYTFYKIDNANRYNVDVYADGFKVKTFIDIEIAINYDLYFTKGQANEEVLLAEVKAWNVRRKEDQIRENRYTSFYQYTGSAINDQIGLGLVANYSGDAQEMPVNIYMPELTRIQWNNTIQKTDFPSHGTIVSKVKGTGIAFVNATMGNPINELDQIIVNASKGKYANKIDLSWFHIETLSNYIILRDNEQIGTESNVSRGTGEQLFFVDETALPGTIYTYKIQGTSADGSNIKVGNDEGFIFPNGTLAGNIKTQSNVYVEDVGVAIGLSDDTSGVNGTALSFTANSDSVTFLDRTLFTDTNEITIEFWYRHDSTGTTGQNIVFKLSDTEILMGDSSTIIKYNKGNTQKAFDTKISDNEWHHYAYALGNSGIELIIDGGPNPNDENYNNNDAYKYSVGFDWNSDSVDYNYYINYNAEYTYAIDEFRVWKGKKDHLAVQKMYNYVVDADEDDLLIAYSMDLQGTKEVYNHALESKGSYVGKSTIDLVYTSQPSSLKYVAFTDAAGNYEFSTIYSNSPTGNAFTATAFKPNHEFRPATVGAVIRQSSLVADYSKVADFTDVSELPVAGRIYYLEGTTKYPVPSGKQIAIDGTPLLGIGDGLQSDAAGVYSVSSSLGLHDFEVFNPALNDNKNLNSLSFSPIEADDVITSGGYAVSKKSVEYQDQGVTLSGFVKPFISVVYPDYVAPSQTLLQWGDFSVNLKNNNVLQLLYKNVLQKETAVTNPNKFTYFAVALDPSGNYGLMVGDNYSTGLISGVTFTNSLLYVGAQVDDTGTVTETNLSNLALIQFRNEVYDESQLLAIKEGDIINNGRDALVLSFEFDQEKGNRAISKTLEGKRNYLVLHNDAKIDASQAFTHTQEYDYTYIAANPRYNPQQGSAMYSLNVVDPMTEVDFEMEDRYGFVGNIVIPCDNSIGAWTGVITRTDSQSPIFEKEITASNFDSEHKIFLVDGLIPGKYQVTLTNQEDTTIELISPIIDLTKGWKSYDFEYRAPLSIEINMYRVKEDKSRLPISELVEEDFDLLQKPCAKDFYIMGEGNPVVLQANVYEQYGDQRCMVSDADVTFSGGLLRLTNGSSITTQTDENGHAVLTSFATTPNFIVPHTRSFTIRAAHDNRSFTEEITGLIEGARMNESDFTIADPIVNYVLHDPPGDGSSTTLKKGTTSITTGKWNVSLGYTGTLSNTTGIGVEQDVVATVFGFGTSIKIAEADVAGGINTTMSILGTYRGSTSTSITNSTDISTSSGDQLVGREADLFIGTGYLITVGSGQTLAYDQTNCAVSYSSSSPVIDNKIDNSFVHSYYDVKKNMIPNLFTSIANEQDPNKIRSYENSVKKWIANLVRNDMVLNLYKKSDYQYMLDHAFLVTTYNELPEELDTTTYNWDTYKAFEGFDKNRSFDGGGAAFTQNITTANTLSNGADFQTVFDFGYKTKVETTVATVTNEFEYSNTINTSFGGGFEITTGDESVVEYTLTDDDAGDRYALEIRRDPHFAIPIYKTLAGQSSCPAERGTQIRTGVEIEAERNSADGIVGEVLRYKVKLRNTQIVDSPRSYGLSLSPTSNPSGAVVRINGALANGGSAISFYFGSDDSSPTGITEEIEAEIEISVPSTETNSNSFIEYQDLKFVFSVPCEFHEDIGFDHNSGVYEDAGIKSIDVLYLSAQFYGPCIEELEMQSPQENWVVNATNNDIQDFTFTIPGTTVENDVVTLPESLTAIDIEYALVDNNTPKLLETIDIDALKTMYRDNAFRVPVNVSGLVDGNYGFRLVPVCGVGPENWRRNVPTPYAYGVISRKAPLLLETNPSEGGILTQGSITATYDSALDPTTLSSLNIALRGTLGGLPKELVSVDFNNVNDEIKIPHGDFLNLSNAYTIEFWVNPTGYPLNNPINLLSKGNNYSLSLQPNGTLNYLGGQTGGATTASLPLAQWTHVAMAYDGITTLNFYFNGDLVHSDPGFNNAGTQVVPNTDDLIIGGTSDAVEGFIGQLDELRIWNESRSHNDIVTYQTRQLLGNEKNLQAYYVFDNNALEYSGYQEAVRDYTGNTIGSSHTGISWIEGNRAAPLQKDQMIQDIPITVSTTIDNNMIIINPLNFQEFYLEGAKLTAIFNGNTIRGVDGNVIEGHSWSFTINKNSVQWDKANITANQVVGKAISIDALLKNTGGADTTFELQSLPEWLKCTSIVVGSNIDLSAGFDTTLNFTTSAYLNKGTYFANVGVISYSQEGIQTGYEYFALELNVGCDAPEYVFNASSFAFKKEFVAQLTVEGQVSEDANDIVVAYFNNEIRGKAQVTTANQNLVLIDVFHNPGESGNLTFSIWDDSDCKEYIGLTELYAIGNGSSEGTTANPVPFETGDVVVKRIPLLEGYQWVSFNSVTNSAATDLQISSIQGMSEGDEIIDLETFESVTFDSNGIANGALSILDYTKAYQVYATSDKLMRVEGVEASIYKDIPIAGGFTDNYVGYIPNIMFEASYALRSLSNRFSTGDRISGREGFSEFTGQDWVGTLTHLIPNKAYNIKMLNSGTLNYSGVIGNTNTARISNPKNLVFNDTQQTVDQTALDLSYLKNAAEKGIVVDDHKYPFTMSLTAKIVSDLIDIEKEYTIVALYGDEYRGVAKAVVDGDDLAYFMTIYGSKQEDIRFKLLADDETYDINNSLIFNKNSFVGTISDAHLLYLSKKSLSDNSVFSIDKNPVEEMANIKINLTETGRYEVSLFNIVGVKVATLFTGEIQANEETIIKLNRTNNSVLTALPSGVYICRLNGLNTMKNLKVMLK